MTQIKTLLFFLVSSVVLLDAQEHALQKVTLQLLWKHQFEFAGYYMAKEKGFYRESGLDVTLLEYQDGIDIIKNVLERKSDFGIMYSNIVLEDPKKVALIGALMQSSPHVLVSLKSSGIKRIEDFKNKKIMMSSVARTSAAFVAMLHSRGVSFDDMKVVKPTYDINTLVQKKVDLSTVYLSNELYILDKEGVDYNVWDPKEYGFDLYSNIVFTSKEELHEYPQRVESFLKASYRGWQYAFEHIDETVDVILEKYNAQHKSRDALIYEGKVLKKLSEYGTEKFSSLDIGKLQRIRDIYNLLGLVTKHRGNTKLKDMLYSRPSAYKFSQQEKAYLQKKKVIMMCIDPDWMPFESLKNGKYIGISADYFQLFGEFIGSQTQIRILPTKNKNKSLEFARERKCDIISLSPKTADRSRYLNFTKPYLKIPVVMATRMDTSFIPDFHALGYKKVALDNGCAFTDILRKEYPELTVIKVKNQQEGLERVAKGEVYGYIGSMQTIVYDLQKHYTGELKIAGKFDEIWKFAVGVRDDDPLLLSIFNKAIESIDARQKMQISTRWLSVKYEKGIDYVLVEKIVAIFGVILLIIGYFYLKLKRLKSKVEKLSLRDPLTDLCNRRYFSTVSEDAFSLFKRNAEIFSVVMFDADDFKMINDTYGHKVGDTVIQSIAKILQEQSRESDIPSRYGGDEFIVLLRNTNIDGAMVLAEKIRVEVEKLHIANIHITVSTGVAEARESDRDIDDITKRADDALYVAKEKGKNLVVKAD